MMIAEEDTAAEIIGSEIRLLTNHVYGVPGFPVNRLLEAANAEVVINEKVAFEYALGNSLSGRRGCIIVKHVGVHPLLDPLIHSTHQGIRAGIVLIVGDDPIAASTQTAEDSRIFASAAMVPILQLRPGVIEHAFDLSEQYSRVVMIRFTMDDLKNIKDLDQIHSTKNEIHQGSLADPDLTMYGRAVKAHEDLSKIKEDMLINYPMQDIFVGPYPKRRSERGFSRTLCKSCQFRILFNLLEERWKEAVMDTGCSLLGMYPPYSFGIASYGMGSSVAVSATHSGLALIGDFAVLHSGIQALIDIFEKRRSIRVIIIQNFCMGATGGQQVPDILPYLSFCCPHVCQADDTEGITQWLDRDEKRSVLIVQGFCPEVIEYETMEC